VGAHSPTLFVDSLPDASVSSFLYPTEELRDQRYPLRLVLAARGLAAMHFFIDAADADVNREACRLMAEDCASEAG
jgi:hypothetical protein